MGAAGFGGSFDPVCGDALSHKSRLSMERRLSRRSIFGNREMRAVSALVCVFPNEYDIKRK